MSSTDHWIAKAAAYQREYEASCYKLITNESFIVREAVIRYRGIGGDGQFYTYERDEAVGVGGFAAFMRNLRKNGVRSNVHIVRRWAVVDANRLRIEIWDHIEMAKAHRDGRNFHYTKWLMTKDMDKLTDELAGGTKR